MTEERVTISILNWLKEKDWEIVAFDFPQSGTGKVLHKNGSTNKNQDTIIPDIIAVKGGVSLFFENKNKYYYKDFEKLNQLREDNQYTQDINSLLEEYHISRIYYGIGFPEVIYTQRVKKIESMVDFIIGVKENGGLAVVYSDPVVPLE
jgi:hypothetical protein